MAQLFSVYQTLPNWAVALLCFPLGLIIGSFSSVLLHRVPKGESIVKPGSHCGFCHHPLAWKDLIPVVSYLWLRGRCRYCTWPVAAKYVWLEVVSGLWMGCGALWLGWYGAGAALCAWLAGVSFAALRGRRQHLGAQAGGTLVEVLAALFVLVLALVPSLDVLVAIRAGTPFQYQMATALAVSRFEELQRASLGVYIWDDPSTGPTSGSETVLVAPYRFRVVWTIEPLPETELEHIGLRAAQVTATCQNCQRPVPPAKVVGYLAKVRVY